MIIAYAGRDLVCEKTLGRQTLSDMHVDRAYHTNIILLFAFS